MNKSTKIKGGVIAILFSGICFFLSTCGNQKWESPKSASEIQNELPAIIPDSISGDTAIIIGTDTTP